MATNHNRTLYRDYESAILEKEAIARELEQYKEYYAAAKRVNEALERRVAELESIVASLKEANSDITHAYKRLKAIYEQNGSNSGIPTSKTPIYQKKHIPNSRKKGEHKRGGQTGHAKSTLTRFEDREVSENVEHRYEVCPVCGGELEYTGKDVTKDETDYDFYVIKRRHHFPECRCKSCGKVFRKKVPNSLKEENQYGPQVQALLLSLTNIGFVSVNRAQKMVYGFSEEQIDPSEGYIMKLQKRASKELEAFCLDLRSLCLTARLLYWDDTVIDVDTKRCCLRYYGNEQLAYYTAHEHKDKSGIEEDNILPLLSPETVVMHDHNILNYNEEFQYQNVECNAHLLRDLQKAADHTGHVWAKELKEEISTYIHKRNCLLEAGQTEFTREEVRHFFRRYLDILAKALREIEEDTENHYDSEERALVIRLVEYKEEYFGWVTNFELPVTNNISERSLRMVKTKMKVSGMFSSIQSAKDFARIRSYTETCRRNGVNEAEALRRLCSGNPVTVRELFTL